MPGYSLAFSCVESQEFAFLLLYFLSNFQVKDFEMRKVDLCSSTEGTEVILATSSDEKHPPENIIDG